MSATSSPSHPGAREGDISTRGAPAVQQTHAAAASSLGTASDELPRVQHVLYARLPCRWVPGPPIACLAASLEPPTPPAAAAETVVAPETHEVASPVPSANTDVSAAPPALTVASTPAAPPVGGGGSGGAQTAGDKSDSAFHVAQHFLSTSGASLLYYANPSFYLTVRNGIEGQGGASSVSTRGGGATADELTEEGQRNMLSSPAAAAALRERYDPDVAPAATAPSATSSAAVEWKKLEWVRQQCRYTGMALVEQPAEAHPLGGAASPPPPSAAAHDLAPSLPAVDMSAGARFIHTLLHPFAASTVPAISGPAASGAPAAAAAAATPPASRHVVPHGTGVMTYVLYGRPRGGYGYAADAATAATAQPLAPFLPPLLIPTSHCPPLAELETPATTAAGASPSEAATPLLLLALVVYEGGFERGRRHGRGRLTAYGRVVLECTWVHDVPCLAEPWPSPSAAAPALWRIDAHVGSAPAGSGLRGSSVALSESPPSWAVRTEESYMGALMLATAASRRLLAKLEALVGTSAALVAESVTELYGARYVPLPIPHTWCTQPSLAAVSTPFRGLAWVNSTVFLPDGFGEAHQRTLRVSSNSMGGTTGSVLFPSTAGDPAHHVAAASASAFSLVAQTPAGPYHPPLWVPERSETVTAPGHTAPGSLVAQYCGQWSVGLPHGFGTALQRLGDPTAASLAMSAATAGAGPPQYPWRTLFMGQYVSGVRRGPGTYHAAQGSEATEVVVCGTWPRHSTANSASANVVLLPVASSGDGGGGEEEHGGSPRRAPTSPSFFSLQGARWEDAAGDGGNGGGAAMVGAAGHAGGAFPSATLRQTSAALSGMWEPVFRVVDDVMAHQGASCTFDALELDEDADADARERVLWQRACAVMDDFLASPECVAAMRCIQACFAFVYGADDTGAAADMPGVAQRGDTVVGARASVAASSQSPTATAAANLLRQLGAASTTAPTAGYPWCPQHSWCAMGHLHAAQRRGGRESGGFASCLHAGLQEGATHRTSSGSAAGQRNGKPLPSSGAVTLRQQPPLSAVAAALEPYAAAHTFTHAMHAAAALVSSLRLRLLSSLADYPDLCEVVMGNKASEDRVVQHAWRAAFRSVGAVLLQRATAVAVADVRLIWAALGLEVTAADQDEKETLLDFDVALRRCRGLQCADLAAPLHNGDDDDGGGVAVDEGVRRCVEMLARWMEAQERSSPAPAAFDAASEDELRNMVQLLSAFCGLSRVTPTCVHEAAIDAAAPPSPAQAARSPPQREALLRWAVLSACTSGAPTTTRNLFALFLIGHFLLSRRVAPGYPTVSDGTRTGNSAPDAPRLGLLGCLTELARAAHQLIRTYPSVRVRALTPSQTWVPWTVCPLDVLARKAEYAFVPCAALHLCTTARDFLGVPDAAGDDAPSGGVVQVSVERLSSAAQTWCRFELTARHSSAALQRRLAQYWARLTPSTPGPQAGGASSRGHSTNDADAAPPPTPLMRWVLACVQGVLSSPLMPPVVQHGAAGGGVVPAESLLLRRLGTAVTPPPPTATSSAPPLPPQRYSWRKFISAAFFTAAERESWGTASATGSPFPAAPTAAARALSLLDECFLIALAFTLGELAGIELHLVARFVFDDADDDDQGADADAVQIGGDGVNDNSAHAAGESAVPPLLVQGLLRRRPPHSHRGGRKNIFLSSSSSSSSATSDAPAQDSPAAAPHPPTSTSVGLSPVPEAVTEDAGGAAAAMQSAVGTAASTQPSTPTTHQHWADTSTQSSPRVASPAPSSAQASPRDGATAGAPLQPALSPGRQRSQSTSTLGVTAAPLLCGAGPVGKEWELTMQLPLSGGGTRAAAATDSAASTAAPAVRAASPLWNGLAWEVLEKVCTSVVLRLQSTAQTGDSITASATELERAKKGRGVPRGGSQAARPVRK